LDVLDHTSDSFSFGGKAGIDATIKLPEEIHGRKIPDNGNRSLSSEDLISRLSVSFIKSFNLDLFHSGINALILSVNPSMDPGSIGKAVGLLGESYMSGIFKLVVAVDHTVNVNDIFTVAWQTLGNSDPVRDHVIISPSSVLIDGTIKYYREGGFPRAWPNIVCSDAATIKSVDDKWNSLGFETFIPSPSLKSASLLRKGNHPLKFLVLGYLLGKK
jgi:4-hydroxy-3-polyprenylbenzoate decarboxylase